jgi:hypothetical protein
LRVRVVNRESQLYTDHVGDFTLRHPDQVGTRLKIRLIFSMERKPRAGCRRNRIMIRIYADTRIIRIRAQRFLATRLMKDEVGAEGTGLRGEEVRV